MKKLSEEEKIVYDMMNYQRDYHEQEFLDLLPKINLLRIKDNIGNNPIFYYIEKHKRESKTNQIKPLLTENLLFQKNNAGEQLFNQVIIHNKDYQFFFNKNEIYQLLLNCDVNSGNKSGVSIMEQVMLYNQSQLDLDDSQLKYLWKKTNKINQENIFLKLINYGNDEQIRFLLYDCKIIIEKDVEEILEKIDNKNILQMIEKRDILFHLNDFLDINQTKINKQKI
jgi:hypothetical protein